MSDRQVDILGSMRLEVRFQAVPVEAL